MELTIANGPDRRARLRRLALAAFLGFCTISAVIHFTLGSIIAALLPKEAPVADQIAQKISILTIYRLVPDRAVARRPTPTVQQQVARVEQPQPKHFQVIKTPSKTNFTAGAPLASAIDPVHPPALARSSKTAHSSSSSSPMIANSPNGMTQATQAQPANGTGQSGSASGEDLNFPGRQMPSGAVWTENGPPGTSGAAGGVIMSGGGGGGGHGDSCAPGRGDFF